MATFSDLIEEVLLNLAGFSQDTDSATTLTASIDNDDTLLSVNDADQVNQGILEIEDELMLVLVSDPQNNTVTVRRGWRGTTAASHASASLVVGNPRFPRQAVKNAINDTIRATYPTLFVVTTTKFNFLAGQRTYEMPVGTEEALSVNWSVPGPTKTWPQLTAWRLVRDADATMFPSGVALTMAESVVPGREVQVVLRKKPTVLANLSDNFATVTGYEDQIKDVVVYGACYRLVSYLEAGRTTADAIEAGTIDQQRPPGIAKAASQFFYALYTQRMQEEQMRLLQTHYGQTTIMTVEY